MVDREVIENLLEYFKKLQKVLTFEEEFSFAGYKLIKKTKIDDVLCCILVTLPISYKKIMKMEDGKKLGSVLAYDLLFKTIKQRFILNSNVYLIGFNDSIKYIKTILRDLEKDIEWAEKHVN